VKQLTVLLIDDFDTVAEVLAVALTEAGYKVITALSGKEALDLFSANHVDVILSDLCMPHMNGLEVAHGKFVLMA
jgi:CheY-like chemotaxis protein